MNKEILNLLPTRLLKILLNIKKDGYRWTGNYKTFAEALANSTGYESNDIIENTINRGTSSIEQKEVSIISNIQLMASMFVCLNHIQKNIINVLDFGGATGGHFRLLKQFISTTVKLNYTICETKALVSKATDIFTNSELSFIDDINKINFKPDIILSSGTLQYLDNPIKIFEEFISLKPQFIVLDRFPIIESASDRLTVQHVPRNVYNGTYPCWFFSTSKWEEKLKGECEILIKWNPKNDYVFLDGEKVYQAGYVLRNVN